MLHKPKLEFSSIVFFADLSVATSLQDFQLTMKENQKQDLFEFEKTALADD